jgi:adenosylcobinamide-GDP ribazoletransferase
MNFIRHFIRHYLLAIQFFTRIPVTGRLADWVGYSPAMLRASAAHFPGVGWVAALVAAAVYALVFIAFPDSEFSPLAAGAFCTIATVMLTGGFHEDGLADVADGLGGSVDRLRALEIMKDSRVGAYGSMALTLTLLTKVALLAVLGSQGLDVALTALVGAHVLSRFWPLVLVRTMAHVGDAAGSKSKPLADQMSTQALFAAFLWCLVPLALVYVAQDATFLIASVVFSGLALVWMWRFFARRLQGFTGDCLGATQQVCEIAFYAGCAVALGAATSFGP